jgi:hypothetical protein
MAVLVVGSNPGLALYDADDADDAAPVAFASAWRVDWSTHGSGSARRFPAMACICPTCTHRAGSANVYGVPRRR